MILDPNFFLSPFASGSYIASKTILRYLTSLERIISNRSDLKRGSLSFLFLLRSHLARFSCSNRQHGCWNISKKQSPFAINKHILTFVEPSQKTLLCCLVEAARVLTEIHYYFFEKDIVESFLYVRVLLHRKPPKISPTSADFLF